MRLDIRRHKNRVSYFAIVVVIAFLSISMLMIAIVLSVILRIMINNY